MFRQSKQAALAVVAILTAVAVPAAAGPPEIDAEVKSLDYVWSSKLSLHT